MNFLIIIGDSQIKIENNYRLNYVDMLEYNVSIRKREKIAKLLWTEKSQRESMTDATTFKRHSVLHTMQAMNSIFSNPQQQSEFLKIACNY